MHPGGDSALLQEAGLVDDQHAVRLTEPLGYLVLQIVTDLIRVPLAPRQQLLQSVRGVVARLLGYLLAVLEAHRPSKPRT